VDLLLDPIGRDVDRFAKVSSEGCPFVDFVLVVLPAFAVVMREKVEAERVRGVVVEDVPYQNEIAKRFAHLFALVANHTHVHPITDERLLTGRAFRLGDFTLVVGEDEVGATAVDVDGRPEITGRHGAALDVPSWTPRAPRRIPGRFAGRGGLPEHE